MSCTAGTVTRRDALEIVVSAEERSAVVVMRNHSEEGAGVAAAAVVAVGQDCVTVRSDRRAEEEGRGQ